MTQDKPKDKPPEYDKVDRALEIQVIDWLQWSEFPENIGKRPDDSDMAQLTLTLLSKRKKAYNSLQARVTELQAELKRCQKLYQESWKAFTNWINGDQKKALDGIRSIKIKQLQAKLDLAIKLISELGADSELTKQALAKLTETD